MIRAFLRKALWDQTWPTLGFLALVGVAALILQVAGGMQTPPHNPLSMARISTALVAWAGGLGLAHRFVGREFGGRTQPFLEALPVSPREVLAIQSILGGAVFMIAILTPVGVALLTAEDHVIPPALAEAVLMKAALLGVFFWGVWVPFSLLGRYRVFVAIMAIIALWVVQEETSFHLLKSSPLSLLARRFGTDSVLDVEQAWLAVKLGALGQLFALAMVAMREKSVSSRLSGRMSQREKAFIVTVLFASGMPVLILYENDEKQDFRARDSVSGYSPEFTAIVRYRPYRDQPRPEARNFAERVAYKLGGAAHPLRLQDERGGLHAVPPILLVARRDLDPRLYRRGYMRGRRGVLVRIHPGGEGWDEDRFVAWLVSTVIAEKHAGRPQLERQRWINDGAGPFLLAMAERDGRTKVVLDEDGKPNLRYPPVDERGASAGSLLDARPDLVKRSLYALDRGLDERAFVSWYSMRERLGDDIAVAAAATLLIVLAEEVGEAAVLDFFRATITRRLENDARDSIYDWRAPPIERLGALGLSPAELVKRWRLALERRRSEHVSALQKVAKLKVSLTFTEDGHQFKIGSEPPLEDQERVQLRWVRLRFIARPLEADRIRTYDLSAAAAAEGEAFPGLLKRGSRVALAGTWFSDELGCEVSSGVLRAAVP